MAVVTASWPFFGSDAAGIPADSQGYRESRRAHPWLNPSTTAHHAASRSNASSPPPSRTLPGPSSAMVHFTAARWELGDDVAGITVPAVGVDDALALVYRLNKQGGKFVATAPRWLVVPKGKLPDVLKQATREVVFNADGRMTVHLLKAQAEASSKAEPSTAGNTASPQVPSHVQTSAPKKPTEQKPVPSTPVKESSSSTRWPMLAVVMLAASGLLWLLLKKRK